MATLTFEEAVAEFPDECRAIGVLIGDITKSITAIAVLALLWFWAHGVKEPEDSKEWLKDFAKDPTRWFLVKIREQLKQEKGEADE